MQFWKSYTLSYFKMKAVSSVPINCEWQFLERENMVLHNSRMDHLTKTPFTVCPGHRQSQMSDYAQL